MNDSVNGRSDRRNAAVLLACLLALTSGCRRNAGITTSQDTNDVRGTPIAIARTNANTLINRTQAPLLVATNQFDGEFLRLSFEQLSNFKYDTYDVYDEVNGGRPLTRSDDVIPPQVKALDGQRIAAKGFIMPLRLKKGLVTEFLLFRDQAACCFEPAAKMNHYIRVTMAGKGFEPGSQLTHIVRGTLRVGEIYVQGYLTGIYQMTAVNVEEEP